MIFDTKSSAFKENKGSYTCSATEHRSGSFREKNQCSLTNRDHIDGGFSSNSVTYEQTEVSDMSLEGRNAIQHVTVRQIANVAKNSPRKPILLSMSLHSPKRKSRAHDYIFEGLLQQRSY